MDVGETGGGSVTLRLQGRTIIFATELITMTPTSRTFRPIDLISSVALIALCWLLPHYSGLPIFIYPVVVLAVIWAYLRWVARETFADLLFDWKRFRVGAVVRGVVVAISLSLFFKYAWDPFIHLVLPGAQNDVSAFAAIRHNPVNYAITLLLGIAVGGFYEELIFHGFIFTRLERLIPGRALNGAGLCTHRPVVWGLSLPARPRRSVAVGCWRHGLSWTHAQAQTQLVVWHLLPRLLRCDWSDADLLGVFVG